MYAERIASARVRELSPVVFAAAGDGDVVARAIVDRLADEIVAMAGAMIRRLRLQRRDPEVILGGGVFRTSDAAFYGRIEDGVRAIAPAASTIRLTVPPIVGAALIGLDALGVAGVDDRVRSAIARWDASVG
jgi:N-acetylglucosamine kinase-like BadF-type ATPase